MKPVPQHIVANGPPGTLWFGGAVDRSTMTLRVMAKAGNLAVDKLAISRLLGCDAVQGKTRHWSLAAPYSVDSDLDSQVSWILSRLSEDVSVWAALNQDYRLELFCGLFLERNNRGVSVSPTTMSELGKRGIALGFDIYAPDDGSNQSTDPTLSSVTPPAGQEPRPR